MFFSLSHVLFIFLSTTKITCCKVKVCAFPELGRENSLTKKKKPSYDGKLLAQSSI